MQRQVDAFDGVEVGKTMGFHSSGMQGMYGLLLMVEKQNCQFSVPTIFQETEAGPNILFFFLIIIINSNRPPC